MIGDEEMRQPDNELVSLAAAGDTAAFEEIYKRYRRFVYGVALRMTRNPADAEDLAQESFITLMRKLGSFRGEAAFTTWLCRLTINQVLMHFRHRRARPEGQMGELPEHTKGRTGDTCSSSVYGRLAIEQAVAALPPGYQAAFILHDIEGYEHKEIARLMRYSTGNSKSQLHRARAKLRALLSNQTPVLQT
jgi:RNA polymerase sigma-70 factor (ECF subfamily)